MNEYDSERIYDITKKINYKRTEDLNEINSLMSREEYEKFAKESTN